MAKGIYVGIDSKARKVKKVYVGVDNKARKVKKGYIGVAGVAQLFYDSTTVSFDSNPVPTNWEQYISPSTAVNEYGTWTASVGGKYSTYAYLAFDENDETVYQSVKLSSTESLTATLKCPSGVYVRPKTITIIYRGTGVNEETNAKSTIEGYNINTNAWEVLEYLPNAKTKTTKEFTFNLSENAYYNAFRITQYRYSSAFNIAYLYDFQITSGTLKLK